MKYIIPFVLCFNLAISQGTTDKIDSIRVVTITTDGLFPRKVIEAYCAGKWRYMHEMVPQLSIIGLGDSINKKLNRSEYSPGTPLPAVVDSNIWMKKWREDLYTPLTDSRLTDARTPTAHNQTKSTITDFAHTHPESDVTNLTTDLSGKQATLTRSTGLIVYSALANGTTAMAFGTNSVVKVTPTANATYTTTVPAAGTHATLIILTSGTASYTITFGTGFRPLSTLATGTVTAKIFTLNFVSDGTTLIESTGRTTAH